MKKYIKPRVVNLGETFPEANGVCYAGSVAQSVGDAITAGCFPGGNASGAGCSTGLNPGTLACNAGGQPSYFGCQAGLTASQTCNSGNGAT